MAHQSSEKNHEEVAVMNATQSCSDATIFCSKSLSPAYKVNSVLGNGAYATCFDVTEISGSGSNGPGKVSFLSKDSPQLSTRYTLKVIPHALVSEKRSLIEREIRIHRQLNHKNVVRLIRDFHDVSRGNWCIVLDLCINRSVADYMSTLASEERISGNTPGKYFCLPESTAAFIFRGLLKGLAYLHGTMNVVHRDIKPANLMLTDTLRVKISDFGLACSLSQCWQERNKICGSPNYLAPEVFLKRGHSPKSDVWSAGVTLYFMLTGRATFSPSMTAKSQSHTHPPLDDFDVIAPESCGNDDIVHTIYRQVLIGEYHLPTSLSSESRKLVFSILRREPCDRPNAEELLQNNKFVEIQICQCNSRMCFCSIKKLTNRFSRPSSVISPVSESNVPALPSIELESTVHISQHPLMDLVKIMSDCRDSTKDFHNDCNVLPKIMWITRWAFTNSNVLYYMLNDGSMGGTDCQRQGILLLPDRKLVEFQSNNSVSETMNEYLSPDRIKSKCDFLCQNLAPFSPGTDQLEQFKLQVNQFYYLANCTDVNGNINMSASLSSSIESNSLKTLSSTSNTKLSKLNQFSTLKRFSKSFQSKDNDKSKDTYSADDNSNVNLRRNKSDLQGKKLLQFRSRVVINKAASAVYVRQWAHVDRNIIFVLTNGLWQINFHNHAKLLVVQDNICLFIPPLDEVTNPIIQPLSNWLENCVDYYQQAVRQLVASII